MYTSLFEIPKTTTVTTLAEATQPLEKGAELTAVELAVLERMNDERLQRITNLLQAVASLIAIIYFLNSFFKK
jgi:hypothetical protein